LFSREKSVDEKSVDEPTYYKTADIVASFPVKILTENPPIQNTIIKTCFIIKKKYLMYYEFIQKRLDINNNVFDDTEAPIDLYSVIFILEDSPGGVEYGDHLLMLECLDTQTDEIKSLSNDEKFIYFNNADTGKSNIGVGYNHYVKDIVVDVGNDKKDSQKMKSFQEALQYYIKQSKDNYSNASKKLIKKLDEASITDDNELNSEFCGIADSSDDAIRSVLSSITATRNVYRDRFLNTDYSSF